MGLLVNNGLPLYLKSRRGAIIASVLSIFLVVALWDTFSADAPRNLGSKWRPPGFHNRVRPGVTPGPGAPLKNHDHQQKHGNASREDPLCARHPDMRNIGVVVKTGATEAFARMPTQYLTLLRCVESYIVLSDMEQNIGGFPIHDALDNMLASAKEGNSDFDIYRDQQACEADVDACTSGHSKSQAGWNLDKYKNTHAAEKAWRMMPGKDWYIFIDADSYVLWNSLVAWLGRLDPKEERYFGSQAYLGDFPFSHGGSGYILSKATMETLVGRNPGLGNRYDEVVHKECCGDVFFSRVVKELVGKNVENAFPTINGEQPFSIPFGPNAWCQPIVTMHHISTEQISAFWEWETDHYASLPADAKPQPILIKDIHDAFFAPRLLPHRLDWDNMADDALFLDWDAEGAKYDDDTLDRAVRDEEKRGLEKEAHVSFNHCKRACEENKGCFQFRFLEEEGVCGFGFAMRLGKPAPREGVVSGWNLGKIERWVGKRQTCEQVEWPEL